ncbi:MAG: zinc ribbon domain-containing protein [Phycisphaerales bacterium]|nr:zinc ribbon domain-containing protein [Phycisphaerales bacterium]
MDSAEPTERGQTGPKSAPNWLTPTHIGLVVVITLVFASVGVMMVLLVAMSGSSGLGWRSFIDGLTSWRTMAFLLGCPLLCAGTWVGVRALQRRLAWDRRTGLLMLLLAWMLVCTASALAAFGTGSLLLLQFAWGGLLPLGTGFITHGLTRRVGTAPHCSHCGYEFDSELDRCPECGAAWRRRGGVIEGRPHRSRVLVGTGVALLVLGVLLTIRPLLGQAFSPLVPTRFLIAQASGRDTWSPSDWTELMSRRLSGEQVQRLADGLLDRRWHTGRLDPSASGWLEKEIVGNTLAATTRERYFREMVMMHLRGPSRARVGERVKVEALVDDRSTPFAGLGARVLFAGFRVNGQAIESTRLDRLASAYDFDEWSVKRKPGAALPSVEVAAERTGVLVIEVQAWILYGPEGLLGWGRAWNDDGSPLLPEDPLWVEVVHLRHEISVE